MDDDDQLATITLLALPLALLLLKGRMGEMIFDKVVVWIFFIYLIIALIYVVNNEGKAQSNQVIWDDGHFSTNLRDPVIVGDYAVFWDGINTPVPFDYKKRVVVCHKDNYEKNGQSFNINCVCYRRSYYEVPEDAKKVFRTYKLGYKDIVIGYVSKAKLSKDASFLFFEGQMARLSDENESNRQYAIAKMGDFEGLAVSLGRLGDIGGKKNLVERMADKLKGSGNQNNEQNK